MAKQAIVKHSKLLKTLLFIAFVPVLAFAQPVNTSALAVPNLPTQKLPVQKRLPVPSSVKKQLDNATNKAEEAIDKPLPSITDAIPETSLVKDQSGNVLFKEVTLDDGSRAIERQWMIMLSQPELLQLTTSIEQEMWPMVIVDKQLFNALDKTLVTFTVSKQFDKRTKLASLFSKQAANTLDRNHVYRPQNQMVVASEKPLLNTTKTSDFAAVCSHPVTIGVMDTSIDLLHELFEDKDIQQKIFLPDNATIPTSHATAVVGRFFYQVNNTIIPNAKVKSASVFYSRENASQGAALNYMLEGLNWLIKQNVSVINMSLTGPDNRILKVAVESAIEQGVVIVAAAGNEGPASPPLYPAAYDQVIAVTAVDGEQTIYRWANQGDYIDFAAEGVSVMTSRSNGGYGIESGTSMAAPVVTAAIACEQFNRDLTIAELLSVLTSKVIDLGDKGHDPVFGHGLIQ